MRIGANGQLQVSASSIHLRLPTTWTSSSTGKYLICDLKSTSGVYLQASKSKIDNFKKEYVIFWDLAILTEEVKGRGAAAEHIRILEFNFETIQL